MDLKLDIDEVKRILPTLFEIIDPNKITIDGYPLLHYFSLNSEIDLFNDVVEDDRIDINLLDHKNGKSALCYACQKNRVDMVQILLDHPKIDVNKNSDSILPFGIACAYGSTEVVKLLLNDNRVQINIINNLPSVMGHISPFSVACLYDHYNIAKIIIESERMTTDDLQMIFYNCCMRNHFKTVKFILQNTDSLTIDLNKKWTSDKTGLYMACSNNSMDVVKLLLEDDRIDLNASEYDDTMNNGSGYTLLYKACYDKNDVLVSFLLKDGRIDPNKGDDRGMTPLHLAYLFNHYSIIQLLIADERVDQNKKDKHGKIPRELGDGKTGSILEVD